MSSRSTSWCSAGWPIRTPVALCRTTKWAAARTVQAIYDRAQDLRRFPEIGQRYAGSSRHVRILLYEHYRIAYLVKDDGYVDILGVFHGALDIARYRL